MRSSRFKTSSAVRSVALVAALLLAVVSCSPDDSEEEASAGDGETEDTGQASNEDGDGGVVGEGETLRVNWGGFPDNWLPGADFPFGNFRVPYETLVTYDEPGGEIVGRLASDWELGDNSITFELREDVTFHDGAAFDAEAAQASMEAMKDAEGAIAGPMDAVESIEVVDDYTIEVTTTGPAPAVLDMLTKLTGFMYSPDAIQDGTLADEPVGTGPWAYNADASSETTLVFDYFEDYWGGREAVGFDTVEIYEISDATAIQGALESGEIDVAGVEFGLLDQIESAPNLDYHQYPHVRNGVFFFDRGPDGTFGDAQVRRAGCHAINNQTVADLEGDIEPATQVFQEGEVGHNPDLTDYEHDLGQAESLLEEAGNPTVEAGFLATVFTETQTQIYADQMSETGMDISVQTVPPPEWFQGWSSGDYPLGMGSIDETHPYFWYQTWWAEDGSNNPSGHVSDELQSTAEEAIAAGAGPEAEELWAEVAGIVQDEALMCGHMVGQQAIAYATDRVSGVDDPPNPWEPNMVNYRDLRPPE